MLKNIIGGIAVGIANIIPGVSGGTFIVLLGLFDQLMESISNIFNLKIKLKNKKNDAIFIAQFLLGAAIGLIGFAKILEVLFVKFEVQTLYWFIGLILLSVPMLKRKEMNGEGINWLFLAIGLLLIAGLSYFSPGESGNIVPLEELVSKNMNLGFCLTLVGIGAIGGASMMFPGVSGSMVLLVLGYYHLFKGYVAHVTSFEPMILVALIFIAIGVGLGIITSAMITNYLLKHYKRNTMSFILGLIIMSAIVIIPDVAYTVPIIISSIVCFLFGATVILIFDRYSN